MIFRNIFNIFRNIRKRKTAHLLSNCVSSLKCSFSSEPVNLSFSKFQPVEVSDSPPVLILHGFLGSKQNWRGLARAVAERSGRQVYSLDARNHGDSPHSESFSYDVMSEDVKHFMASETISSAVLLGHSMGGRTAMKLALADV